MMKMMLMLMLVGLLLVVLVLVALLFQRRCQPARRPLPVPVLTLAPALVQVLARALHR